MTGRVLRAPGPGRWIEQAACKDKPLHLFFPEVGEFVTKEARDTCTLCPVRTECLEYASYWQLDGVWGGMSRNEREAARRRAYRHRYKKQTTGVDHIRYSADPLLEAIPGVRALADAVGVTTKSVYRWTHVGLTARQAARMADALSKPVTALWPDWQGGP